MFIFKEQERLLKQLGKEFEVQVSAIEIYLDQLRDLFSDSEPGKGPVVDLKVDPTTKKVFV